MVKRFFYHGLELMDEFLMNLEWL